MKNTKFIGLVFLVVAVGLAYMGYSDSQGAVSSIASTINGRLTDQVMFKYIGAVILTIAGLFLLKK